MITQILTQLLNEAVCLCLSLEAIRAFRGRSWFWGVALSATSIIALIAACNL